MGFIKKLRITKQAQKVSDMAAEEKLYELVNLEVESNKFSKGLWVKATTSTGSSEYEDIKKAYIPLRVERLLAEGKLYSQIADEISLPTIHEPEKSEPSQKEISHHENRSKPWYVREAEQEHVNAQFNLGMRYEEGQGVPQNYSEAYVWFSLAALSGGDDAIKSRDLVARKLSPEDLSVSQERAAKLHEEIQQRKAEN